ncbi:MAG: peptide-methionine (S)-S-oxide reductase MsrA [Bacteroidales bacterium]
MTENTDIKLEQATFGCGCFWCSEALFKKVDGVEIVEPGYSGGSVVNPDYKSVCTGETGHAEVIQITYNPKIVSFIDLLMVFWETHDPTTINRQGPDVGSQYRSAIFYHSAEQQREAEQLKKVIDDREVFDKAIVTEIVPFDVFYKAEDYHHNYFELNPKQPYCNTYIAPKLERSLKKIEDYLKQNS